MKIVDSGPRRRKWPARLLLLAFALVVALAGLGFFNRAFLSRVRHDPRGILVEAPRNYLHARLHAPRLQDLHFHLKFKDYERILAKREEAMHIGLLFTGKKDEVPATLEVDGRKMPVKMRLKGDWPDHFQTDKWSFRVRMRKGTQFGGMRRFSIQHPRARRYLGEWLFLNSMRREGILAPRYDFVRVTLNGDPKGIFAIEEHFAKELLESQERTEGPIAKFDEDPLWRQRELSHNRHGLGWFDLDHLDYRSAQVSFFSEGSLRRDPILHGEMEAARHLLEGFQRGTLSASEVFDLPRMARYLALCRVWGADHSLIWHNLRFYYNPHTTRLEPIAFDGEPWGWNREDMDRTDIIDGHQISMGLGGWYPWMRDFLADPRALALYMRDLWRFSDPAWSDSLLNEYGDELEKRLLALRLEWPRLEGPVPALRRGQDFFRGKLQPLAAMTGEYEDTGDSLVIELASVCDLPLELTALRLGDHSWEPDAPLVLPSRRQAEEPHYRRLSIPLSSPLAGAEVTAIYRSYGLDGTRQEQPLRPVPGPFPTPAILPPAPSDPSAFARSRRWIRWDASAGELLVEAGDWTIDGDIILPAVPTRIEAGVSLHMQAGTILLARARLDIDGTGKNPVRLLATADTTWGGIYLMDAPSASRWSHLEMRDTAGANRAGWLVTGGANVHGSEIEIVDSRFEGHRGEDAVHLIHTRAHLQKVIIGNCPSDALDGDFIEATLVDCSFHDVGGDAIDISGSTVDATRIEALRIGDKAFSAGEDSHLRLREFLVIEAGIGIASKDLSSVVAQEGEIRETRIGLTAYVKKAVFGPARLVADHLHLEDVGQRALVQTGSFIRLDGENQASRDFDVKQLYEQGVLGK